MEYLKAIVFLLGGALVRSGVGSCAPSRRPARLTRAAAFALAQMAVGVAMLGTLCAFFADYWCGHT